MFDIGWSEMVVVGVVALVVIGPKELPAALRTAGRMLGKARSIAGEFRQHWDDAMREAELDEIRKKAEAAAGLDEMKSAVDAIGDVKMDLAEASKLPDSPSIEAPPPSAPEPATEPTPAIAPAPAGDASPPRP
jgi:sec-independent protein translocase protein TatB